jgi:hypothetical protein
VELKPPIGAQLMHEAEVQMRASVSRSLAKERELGGSGTVTARLLLQHGGDWRRVERLVEMMARQGRLEAGHG